MAGDGGGSSKMFTTLHNAVYSVLYSTLCSVQGLVCRVYYVVFTLQSAVNTVQCEVGNMKCVLITEKFLVFSIQYSVCGV